MGVMFSWRKAHEKQVHEIDRCKYQFKNKHKLAHTLSHNNVPCNTL